MQVNKDRRFLKARSNQTKKRFYHFRLYLTSLKNLTQLLLDKLTKILVILSSHLITTKKHQINLAKCQDGRVIQEWRKTVNYRV